MEESEVGCKMEKSGMQQGGQRRAEQNMKKGTWHPGAREERQEC